MQGFRTGSDVDQTKAPANTRPATRVETLTVSQQGVTFDNGRLWFRPVAARRNALRIVAIGEPVQPR